MTTEIQDAIQFRHVMPPEAIDFFAAFSRAEYVLKRHGYCHMSNRQLVVDWDDFAREVPGLIGAAEAAGAATTLLNAPPKKQVLGVDNSLEWRESPPVDNDVVYLFAMVRRVRNNLFHGGKFHGHLDTDTSRSVELLRDATWVLYEALRMHPRQDLRNTFYSMP